MMQLAFVIQYWIVTDGRVSCDSTDHAKHCVGNYTARCSTILDMYDTTSNMEHQSTNP